ncbi:MAG: hypothetical protein AAGG68_06875 [Bacteroidota bacterium]
MDEIELLIHHYQLDAYEVFSLPKRQVEENHLPDKLGDFIDQTMQAWVSEVELLPHREKANIFVLTDTLPFALVFHFPDLVKYRLYYMAMYLWQSEEKVLPAFDLSHEVFQNVPTYCKRIAQVYHELPTTEIWGTNTFHACIGQIEYLAEQELISAENVVTLLNALEELIELSKVYAKSGYKQQETPTRLQTIAAEYTIFLNKIFNVNEYTLFSWQEHQQARSFVYDPVLGLIKDATRRKSAERNVLSLKKTGIQVSRINSKERLAFLNKARRAIRKYRANMEKESVLRKVV